MLYDDCAMTNDELEKLYFEKTQPLSHAIDMNVAYHILQALNQDQSLPKKQANSSLLS